MPFKRVPGIVDLTLAVKKSFPLPKTKTRMNEFWLGLARTRLIEHKSIGAENSYIMNLLDSRLGRSLAADPRWSYKVKPFLRDEFKRISGGKGVKYAGSALKQRVIKTTLASLADINYTFCQMDSFFTAHEAELRALPRASDPDASKLAVQLVNDVEGIGPFRAIHGLNASGLALHMLPASKHYPDFIGDDLGIAPTSRTAPWKTRTRAGPGSKLSAMHTYFPMLSTLQSYRSDVESEAGESVHIQHLGWAILEYRVIRGLVHQGHRPRVDPKAVLDFLKYKGWGLGEFDGKLFDVEKVEALVDSFEVFLDGYT